jgi:hypothetical protein
MLQRISPCITAQRPGIPQVTDRQTAGSPTPSAASDCPCCTELTTEDVGVTTSHPATPLQMEAAAVIGTTSADPPKAAERVQFARPGRFQLRNQQGIA